MKSKRTYKIIACVSIWLSVIIAVFSLAIAKPKAGVIIESSYSRGPSQSQLTIRENTNNNYAFSYGVPYIQMQSISSNGQQLCQIYNNDFTVLIGTLYIYQVRFDFSDVSMRFQKALTGMSNGTFVQTGLTTMPYNMQDVDAYIIFDLTNIFTGIRSIGNNDTILNNNNYEMACSSFTFGNGGYFFEKANIISACNNIYDLKQNDVALIYLSDISGLSSSAYRDEITINWGYIDNNDNTLFTIHAPTIGAQRTDNNIISLEMPINAAGDATSYYSIDQSAILSTISSGGATATAHIYGIYVWIQQSRIQWGLAEFDTSGLPASGASMNYITSLTNLYDYTAANTSTMTCRLSISNNFNFITIKNQPILSAYNINTVIQQGGFLPAWAVYNWARGSSAGYTSGEQAGAAPYQPGGAGYQEIYEAGRQAGIAENIGTVNWFVSAFEAVDAMLNIRIFPNITIGYLVGIPFVISVVWFIIRMFRGGGSSS